MRENRTKERTYAINGKPYTVKFGTNQRCKNKANFQLLAPYGGNSEGKDVPAWSQIAFHHSIFLKNEILYEFFTIPFFFHREILSKDQKPSF